MLQKTKELAKSSQNATGSDRLSSHRTPQTTTDGDIAKKLLARDLALLKFIGHNGIASAEQLHQVFAKLASVTSPLSNQSIAEESDQAAEIIRQGPTSRKRLAKLERAGYITSQRVDNRKRGELTFVLTAKGAGEFTRQERYRFIVGLPADHELKQQLLAADARLLLEEHYASQGFKLLDWKHERELRREQKRKATSKSRLEFSNSIVVSSGTTKPGSWQPLGRKSQVQLEIADAEAIFLNPLTGEVKTLPIEIDGDYFGKMLRSKLNNFSQMGKPLVWVSEGLGRATRIKAELEQIGSTNIEVLML